jgi:phosphatidylglycerol---prolipoprotein diacylglyceryl transferase
MCPTLLAIDRLSALHAAAVALVLAALMVVWAWREARAGRLSPKEFRESVALGAGLALVIGVALFIASRFVHPIRIRSYGVMLMLAFGVGILIASQRARLYRIDPVYIIDLSLFVLVGSIIGARAFYVLLNWQTDFAGNPRTVLNMWEGGLAFYGGLGGGTLGGLLFCRWRRIRLRVLADLVAPSIAFGYAVARLGCFLNGCCHGGPTHSIFGVIFPTSAALGPVHPAQLYSAAMSWAVGVALLVAAPRVRVPGHVMLWYLVLSSVERIITEVFRHGYTGVPLGFLPVLTQAQGLSILMIAFSLALICLTRRNVGYPLPEEPASAPPPAQTAVTSGSAEPPARRRGRRGKRPPKG